MDTVSSIADLVGILGQGLPQDTEDQRNPHRARGYQQQLAQHIIHGTLDESADEIRAGLKDDATGRAPTSQLALAEDLLIAREMAYGTGSTPPDEVASIFGWGSRLHQQQELNYQQRQRILAESVDPAELPWDDPQWYRDIASQYRIDEINIPDQHNIHAVPSTDEYEGPVRAVAWAVGGSNKTGSPNIRVAYDMIEDMTRSEIENTIAHEMIHTVLPLEAGHGPQFARYASDRNIGMYGTGTDKDLLRPHTGLRWKPTRGIERVGGQVFVHNYATIPPDDKETYINHASPDTWIKSRVHLLASPGDIEATRNTGGRDDGAYYTPGSALMRHWPVVGLRPEYWEIGTVEDDGSVQWDCITYTEPTNDALDDYIKDGYCPPELRQDEVQPSKHEYDDLARARAHYAVDSNSPATHLLRIKLIEKAFSDPTLTADERKAMEGWVRATALADREKFAAASVKGKSGPMTRMFNKERDRIVAERSPEFIQSIEERRQRRLASPDRMIYVGGEYGLNPTHEITFSDPAPAGYRQTMFPYDDPRTDDEDDVQDVIQERADPLLLVADAVQEYKDANIGDDRLPPLAIQREYDGRPQGLRQGTYRPRGGRGKMRY